MVDSYRSSIIDSDIDVDLELARCGQNGNSIVGTWNEGKQICECPDGYTGLDCSLKCGVPHVRPRIRRNAAEMMNESSNSSNSNNLVQNETLLAIINGNIAGSVICHSENFFI